MAQTIALTLNLFDGGGSPVTKGSVVLVPQVQLQDQADGMQIIRAPVLVPLTGGTPVVDLIPTDAPGPQPAGWSWGVICQDVPGTPPVISVLLPAGPLAFTAATGTPGTVTVTPTTGFPSVPAGAGFQFSGTAPAPLVTGTTYYAVSSTGSSFKVAATPGGSPLAFTGAGSGTLTAVSYLLSSLTQVEPAPELSEFMAVPSGSPLAGQVPVAQSNGSRLAAWATLSAASVGALGTAFSPASFGGVGNGTTDDTAAVRACFAAAIAAHGTVDFGGVLWKTTGSVTLNGPVKMRGGGAGYPSGGLTNNASDMFTVVAGGSVVAVDSCSLVSGSAGGHVFNASGASVSAWRFHGTTINQGNPAKAIWYQYQGGAIDFSIDGNCLFFCAQNATLSPMSFLAMGGAANSIRVSRSRFTSGLLGHPASVPFFNFAADAGAHTDTGVGMTAGSLTVTDASAVAGDLGLFVYSANFPGGRSQVTAVTPGTGYTVAVAATATLVGQTCMVGVQGWYEELKFDHVVWEVCANGAIWGNGIYSITIDDCAAWDVTATADLYHFYKGATGYWCQNIRVNGGRGGAAAAGVNHFFADSNCLNIKLDSFGLGWFQAPVISSPAGQTTIINGVTAGSTPTSQIPGFSPSFADLQPSDVGLVAWTASPSKVTTFAGPRATAGTLSAWRFKSGAGGSVQHISYAIFTGQAGTGLANCFIGVFSDGGTLLGSCTTDQSTNFGTAGTYTVALSAAVALAPNTIYRIGVVVGSLTTAPGFASAGAPSSGSYTNLGTTSGALYASSFLTNSYTSLPSNYTPSSASILAGLPVFTLSA